MWSHTIPRTLNSGNETVFQKHGLQEGQREMMDRKLTYQSTSAFASVIRFMYYLANEIRVSVVHVEQFST